MPSKKRLKRTKNKAKTTVIPATSTPIKDTVKSLKPTQLVTSVAQTLTKARDTTTKTIVSLARADQTDKIISTVAALTLLLGCIWLSFNYIPYLYKFTELGKVEDLEAQSKITRDNKSAENARIAGINTAVLKTNFGDIKTSLYRAQTPVTVDNFLRLSDRQKYVSVPFTRYVKSSSFAVIQGGDYVEKNGQGGLAADSKTIQDELWKVFPEYDDTGALINQPQFNVGDAFKDFAVIGKDSTGAVQTQITIKKGYVVMAKTAQPNSASSQFFVTLADTTLPADYSVFAKVNEESFGVLDTLFSTVDPVDETGKVVQDGKPSKPIILDSVLLQK